MKELMKDLIDEGRLAARHGAVSPGAFGAFCALAAMLAACSVGIFAELHKVRPEDKTTVTAIGVGGAVLATCATIMIALVLYGYFGERRALHQAR